MILRIEELTESRILDALLGVGQLAMRIGILITLSGTFIVNPFVMGVGCAFFCIGTYLVLFTKFKSL